MHDISFIKCLNDALIASTSRSHPFWKVIPLKVSHLSQRYVTVHDRETFDQIVLFSESAGLCKGSADRGDGG